MNESRMTPATSVFRPYSDHDIPLDAYAGLIATYALLFSGLFWISTRRDRDLARPQGLDLALLAIASYKFARIVTMSFIASPLRAPFTVRGKSLKAGEVQDRARGHGLQRAIGNLLTCPFCFEVWSSTFFMFGFSIAPRAFRQLSYILSMAAVGDVLHLGYRDIRELSYGDRGETKDEHHSTRSLVGRRRDGPDDRRPV